MEEGQRACASTTSSFLFDSLSNDSPSHRECYPGRSFALSALAFAHTDIDSLLSSLSAPPNDQEDQENEENQENEEIIESSIDVACTYSKPLRVKSNSIPPIRNLHRDVEPPSTYLLPSPFREIRGSERISRALDTLPSLLLSNQSSKLVSASDAIERILHRIPSLRSEVTLLEDILNGLSVWGQLDGTSTAFDILSSLLYCSLCWNDFGRILVIVPSSQQSDSCLWAEALSSRIKWKDSSIDSLSLVGYLHSTSSRGEKNQMVFVSEVDWSAFLAEWSRSVDHCGARLHNQLFSSEGFQRIIVIDYGFSMMRTWHGMHCLLDLASTIQANPIYLLTISPRVLDIPESSALRWIESIFARPFRMHIHQGYESHHLMFQEYDLQSTKTRPLCSFLSSKEQLPLSDHSIDLASKFPLCEGEIDIYVEAELACSYPCEIVLHIDEALRTLTSRGGDFWTNLSTEGRKVLGPYEQGCLGERLSLTNFDDDFLSPAEEESPRMVSFKLESTSFSCSLSTSIGHAIAKSRNDCSLEFSWVFLVDGTLSELGSCLSTFRIPVCSTFFVSQLVSLASNPHQIAIEILPALPCENSSRQAICGQGIFWRSIFSIMDKARQHTSDSETQNDLVVHVLQQANYIWDSQGYQFHLTNDEFVNMMLIFFIHAFLVSYTLSCPLPNFSFNDDDLSSSEESRSICDFSAEEKKCVISCILLALETRQDSVSDNEDCIPERAHEKAILHAVIGEILILQVHISQPSSFLCRTLAKLSSLFDMSTLFPSDNNLLEQYPDWLQSYFFVESLSSPASFSSVYSEVQSLTSCYTSVLRPYSKKTCFVASSVDAALLLLSPNIQDKIMPSEDAYSSLERIERGQLRGELISILQQLNIHRIALRVPSIFEALSAGIIFVYPDMDFGTRCLVSIFLRLNLVQLIITVPQGLAMLAPSQPIIDSIVFGSSSVFDTVACDNTLSASLFDICYKNSAEESTCHVMLSGFSASEKSLSAFHTSLLPTFDFKTSLSNCFSPSTAFDILVGNRSILSILDQTLHSEHHDEVWKRIWDSFCVLKRCEFIVQPPVDELEKDSSSQRGSSLCTFCDANLSALAISAFRMCLSSPFVTGVARDCLIQALHSCELGSEKQSWMESSLFLLVCLSEWKSCVRFRGYVSDLLPVFDRNATDASCFASLDVLISSFLRKIKKAIPSAESWIELLLEGRMTAATIDRCISELFSWIAIFDEKRVSVPKKALLLLISLLRARKRKMNDPDHGSGDYFGGSSPYQACRKKADTLLNSFPATLQEVRELLHPNFIDSDLRSPIVFPNFSCLFRSDPYWKFDDWMWDKMLFDELKMTLFPVSHLENVLETYSDSVPVRLWEIKCRILGSLDSSVGLMHRSFSRCMNASSDGCLQQSHIERAIQIVHSGIEYSSYLSPAASAYLLSRFFYPLTMEFDSVRISKFFQFLISPSFNDPSSSYMKVVLGSSQLKFRTAFDLDDLLRILGDSCSSIRTYGFEFGIVLSMLPNSSDIFVHLIEKQQEYGQIFCILATVVSLGFSAEYNSPLVERVIESFADSHLLEPFAFCQQICHVESQLDLRLLVPFSLFLLRHWMDKDACSVRSFVEISLFQAVLSVVRVLLESLANQFKNYDVGFLRQRLSSLCVATSRSDLVFSVFTGLAGVSLAVLPLREADPDALSFLNGCLEFSLTLSATLEWSRMQATLPVIKSSHFPMESLLSLLSSFEECSLLKEMLDSTISCSHSGTHTSSVYDDALSSLRCVCNREFITTFVQSESVSSLQLNPTCPRGSRTGHGIWILDPSACNPHAINMETCERMKSVVDSFSSLMTVDDGLPEVQNVEMHNVPFHPVVHLGPGAFGAPGRGGLPENRGGFRGRGRGGLPEDRGGFRGRGRGGFPENRGGFRGRGRGGLPEDRGGFRGRGRGRGQEGI